MIPLSFPETVRQKIEQVLLRLIASQTVEEIGTQCQDIEGARGYLASVREPWQFVRQYGDQGWCMGWGR